MIRSICELKVALVEDLIDQKKDAAPVVQRTAVEGNGGLCDMAQPIFAAQLGDRRDIEMHCCPFVSEIKPEWLERWLAPVNVFRFAKLHLVMVYTGSCR
jgi:hypothetical protein